MLWTPDFWLIWIPLTLLLGLGVAAYLQSEWQRGATRGAVVRGSLALWLVSTAGIVGTAFLSPRVIALDSVVNLGAVFAASWAAGLVVK